jgi:hypothetical protein
MGSASRIIFGFPKRSPILERLLDVAGVKSIVSRSVTARDISDDPSFSGKEISMGR